MSSLSFMYFLWEARHNGIVWKPFEAFDIWFVTYQHIFVILCGYVMSRCATLLKINKEERKDTYKCIWFDLNEHILIGLAFTFLNFTCYFARGYTNLNNTLFLYKTWRYELCEWCICFITIYCNLILSLTSNVTRLLMR